MSGREIHPRLMKIIKLPAIRPTGDDIYALFFGYDFYEDLALMYSHDVLEDLTKLVHTENETILKLLEAGTHNDELPKPPRFITSNFYRYLECELKTMLNKPTPYIYNNTDLLLQAAYSLLFKKIIKHV